jgi:hypothetical protein
MDTQTANSAKTLKAPVEVWTVVARLTNAVCPNNLQVSSRDREKLARSDVADGEDVRPVCVGPQP